MEKFSQRMGIQQVNTVIQIDSMDVALRKALWIVFDDRVRLGMASYYAQKFGEQIWKYCFYKLLDEVPSGSKEKLFKAIQEHYFTLEWYEVYDFIEFVANHLDYEAYISTFVEACNTVLKRELSAYRFVGKKLAPVTSEQEITEIEDAIRTSGQFTQHLKQALTLFADRKSPDYRNSIKESISAVEAICQLITRNPKVTLGDALHQLENKLGTVHPALKEAFRKLYGYTNDAQGIRHALLGESDLDVEDARFMLTACSAFINYLMAKAEKAGIEVSPT